MTIKPLLRYGKVWFIDLNRPLRTDINMASPPTSINRTLTTEPKPENSDNSPKGDPVISYAKANREMVTNGRFR
jgi:hypothetical protein